MACVFLLFPHRLDIAFNNVRDQMRDRALVVLNEIEHHAVCGKLRRRQRNQRRFRPASSHNQMAVFHGNLERNRNLQPFRRMVLVFTGILRQDLRIDRNPFFIRRLTDQMSAVALVLVADVFERFGIRVEYVP